MSTDKQVRISGDVYEEIQKRATPFKDTIDSVLRRVLGLPPQETKKKTKNTDAEQDKTNERIKTD
jgi:hypothetical protein